MFKFSQLSSKAKAHAIREYLEGWNELRDEEDKMTLEEASELILDTEDDVFYDCDGNLIEE